MVALQNIKAIDDRTLEEFGFGWHTDNDESKYIANELVVVTDAEAEAYYEAVNELYDMYTSAAQHVIDNNLFFDLGIPFNLIEAIKKSWENDVHWHLYGRFDLSGGINGTPIKLIEFNADTPTSLFETAILQWALLKHNGMDEERQFNNIYEAFSDNFRRLVTLFDDPSDFEKHYDGWKILFSSISGNIEEEQTVRLLQQMAIDAGFETSFEPLGGVKFDDEGIYDRAEEPYEYWFKLYPWEDIAIEEPELATQLTTIMNNQKAIILNPAYTLLFQSKGMMKILCDLFPDSPYLLKTSFEPLKGVAHVEKRMFGREGANVRIMDASGTVIEANDGPYGNFKPIYQEYVEFPKDSQGNCYQAGVFFAYEACGLGFRRGGKILGNMSKFVGHVLR
ncbi:glutathionylspermidine synthase family protein [Sulfuricurvum sp. RIFCSPLOWO2_12_FULL_43_24]|uniref:glutathionylspermidine synthase family protein n=1 Tax=Sulfuricurvum sp. RIFCSPLOWO2_12_FULL_43_24 TaxID=1802247 RepID=UPI0008B82E5A|nr:glutathionylspermidine synthase family protein [Sulfuricurvum sp. RIFCSPLOWO2_12_FULL_43_24]OHD90504.1 MAG: glutathionylspermidine synthase [Sulfuricurvum sp. RIFCSPLOWO2_12_FULL_43_24]